VQLLPHLPYLIGFRFSTGNRLQIQEARSALEDDVAAFGLAHVVTRFGQHHAQLVEGKMGIVLAAHETCEEFLGSAHREGFFDFAYDDDANCVISFGRMYFCSNSADIWRLKVDG
jgi:hypothetical protein